MPRTSRSATLETRTGRAKVALGERKAVKVGPGLSILYRRGAEGAGTWQARRWNGTAYVFAALGEADDTRAADGAEVLTYFEAFDRARAWAKEAAQRVPGTAPIAPSGRGTVGDALDHYLKVYRAGQTKGGGKALASTRQTVDHMIRPELGHLRLEQLTTAKLRHWLQTLAERGRSVRVARDKKTGQPKEARHLPAPTDPDEVRARRASANRIFNVLRAALNLAYQDKWTNDDSAWRAVKPFKKVDEPRIRFLTATQATRLVNACGAPLRRLVRAALLTGARFGELKALRVGDFNPDTAQVYIAASKGGRPRHIPLNVEGLAFFREITTGRPTSEPALLRAGTVGWGKNLYVRPLQQACAVAKIAPAITLHELRHTFASLLAQSGCDLLTISKLLGHADTRITARHYAHLCDRTLQTAVAQLPTFAPTDGSVTALEPRQRGKRGRK